MVKADNKPVNKPLCKRFKIIRNEAGLTQEQYAEHLQITRSAVNAIEHFRYTPTLDIIVAIHKKFKRSYEFIIEGK